MKNYTILNSIFIYISAALLTLVIHETGHFILEKTWHFNATIHANYGSYSGYASDFQKVMIASAGPFLSLLQGAVFYRMFRYRKQKSVLTLLALWLSLHGIVLFFGYLVAAPFFIYGDTGQVFYILKIPFVVNVIISILSVFILLRILNAMSKEFLYYGPEIPDNDLRSKKLILFPVFIGGIFVLLLQLPLPNFLLLFASVTTPLIFLIVYANVKNSKTARPAASIEHFSPAILILLILTMTIVRLLI